MAYTNGNGQARVGVRIVPLSVVIPTISALLDSYSGAAAAYSLRKLKSSYTGSAIRVRRSSDNTEMNIGFDSNGNLDTIALSVFVGTGDGFVTTWYDQSGNGNNAVQTTASSQPQIVSAGSVITMSNKPSVKFTTSNMSFTQIAGVSGLDIFVVSNFTDVTGGGQNWNIMSPILAETGGNAQDFVLGAKGSKMAIWAENNNSIFLQTTATISINTPYIYNGYGSSTSVGVGFNDGNYVTGTGRRNDLIVRALGKNSTSMQFYGNLSEVVVYNSLQTANRSGINTNLNTYYSVYPNPTSVWNLLNAVYSADTTASSSLKTSLVASYNGESNANDSFGTNNGTAVGGLSYGTGKIGNAFVFNGSNSYVRFPDNSFNSLNGSFSVSAWFKTPSSIQAVSNHIFNNRSGNTWFNNPNGFILSQYGNSITFDLYNNTNSYTQLRPAYTFSPNTWYHITATKLVNGNMKVYINGALIGTLVTTVNPTYLATVSKPCIGVDLFGTKYDDYFAQNGFMVDALNIWNKELTASEVSELYNSGNGSQYIGDNFYKPTTNDALGTNNGTAVGGLTYGLGKVGTAFQFNGTNAYVSLPNNMFNSFTGDFSVNMWVNIANTGTYQTLLSSFGGNTSIYCGFAIYNYGTTLVEIYNGVNKTVVRLTDPSTPTYNTWYMVTVTRKASTGTKIYKNGSLTISNSNTVNPLYNFSIFATIGAEKSTGYGTQNFAANGTKIDEVNIWNKELTSTEITELYNSGNGKQYPN